LANIPKYLWLQSAFDKACLSAPYGKGLMFILP